MISRTIFQLLGFLKCELERSRYLQSLLMHSFVWSICWFFCSWNISLYSTTFTLVFDFSPGGLLAVSVYLVTFFFTYLHAIKEDSHLDQEFDLTDWLGIILWKQHWHERFTCTLLMNLLRMLMFPQYGLITNRNFMKKDGQCTMTLYWFVLIHRRMLIHFCKCCLENC